MFTTIVMILILVRELFNLLKGELNGKTATTSVVTVLLLMVALFLKSVGL